MRYSNAENTPDNSRLSNRDKLQLAIADLQARIRSGAEIERFHFVRLLRLLVLDCLLRGDRT